MALPEGKETIDPRELDADARRELRSLSKDTADTVAQHLVMTGRLIDEEPEQALRHAMAAVALAGRVGVVREAAGLAAYASGEWAQALSELRAGRRITGSPSHLAVMADCERALGRPERALTCLEDRDVARLTNAERVELVIVGSGARRDMGQADAAVLLLQDPAQRTTAARPWAARLWYAFADALLDAGREDEAREWFAQAAEVDAAGETDADERLLELDGISFDDAWDGSDDGENPADGGPSAWVVKEDADVMAGFAAAMTASEDARDGTTDASDVDADGVEVAATDEPAEAASVETPAIEAPVVEDPWAEALALDDARGDDAPGDAPGDAPQESAQGDLFGGLFSDPFADEDDQA